MAREFILAKESVHFYMFSDLCGCFETDQEKCRHAVWNNTPKKRFDLFFYQIL